MNLNRSLDAIHKMTMSIAADVANEEINLNKVSRLTSLTDMVSNYTTNSGLERIMGDLSRALNAAAEAGNLDENWRKAKRYMQVAKTDAERALSFKNSDAAKTVHVLAVARSLGVVKAHGMKAIDAKFLAGITQRISKNPQMYNWESAIVALEKRAREYADAHTGDNDAQQARWYITRAKNEVAHDQADNAVDSLESAASLYRGLTVREKQNRQ